MLTPDCVLYVTRNGITRRYTAADFFKDNPTEVKVMNALSIRHAYIDAAITAILAESKCPCYAVDSSHASEKSFQIGVLHLSMDTEYTDRSFDHASCWQRILVPAGDYPVIADSYLYSERNRMYMNAVTGTIHVRLEGTITAYNFCSYFFGIPISEANKYIGCFANYDLRFSTPDFAKAVLDGDHPEYVLFPHFKPVANLFFNNDVYDWETSHGIINTGFCRADSIRGMKVAR